MKYLLVALVAACLIGGMANSDPGNGSCPPFCLTEDHQALTTDTRSGEDQEGTKKADRRIYSDTSDEKVNLRIRNPETDTEVEKKRRQSYQ